MTRRWLFASLAAFTLFAQPLAAQQPAPQGKPDSAAAAAHLAVSPTLLAQAQVDGQIAAANVGTGGWFAGGVASGVLLGLIGTGVTWALAANSSVELAPDKRLLIASQPITYQQIYEKAHADKVKSKRKASALTGGLLGTAAFVLIYLSAQGSDGY